MNGLETAAISLVSVVVGALLNWNLAKRTAEASAKRTERLAIRLALEQKYLSVWSSLELFLRLPLKDNEAHKELAGLNAVMMIFASDSVLKKFKDFIKAYNPYEEAYLRSGKTYASVADASDDFEVEWGAVRTAMQDLGSTMRLEVKALN